MKRPSLRRACFRLAGASVFEALAATAEICTLAGVIVEATPEVGQASTRFSILLQQLSFAGPRFHTTSVSRLGRLRDAEGALQQLDALHIAQLLDPMQV